MARKVIAINDEVKKAQEKLAEVERLKQEADLEEKGLLEKAEADIKGIADENNLFCGIILSHDDLIAVLQLALKTGEAVRIPFRLYFNE